MEEIDSCWEGNSVSGCISLHDTENSFKGLHLIPLPGGKSNIWKFYGMYSQDGVSILPQHSSRVYCMVPGCPNPEMVYCGNTTNLYGHLQRKHPNIAIPEKRLVKPKFKQQQCYQQKRCGRLKAAAQRYARRVRRTAAKSEDDLFEERMSVTDINAEQQMTEDQHNIAQDQYALTNALSVDLQEGSGDIIIVEQESQNCLDFITPGKIISEPKIVKQNSCTQTGENNDESPLPVPGLQKDHVTDALLDLMVSDLIGEQLVLRPGFQKFINTLYPRYDFPTLEEARSSLKIRYDGCKTILRQVLDSARHVSIAVNQWTSKLDGKKNMIVSAWYVDSDWELNHRVLANIGADYCSEEQLRNVLAEYKLLSGKVVSITSNTLLGNIQSDIPQLPCFDSALDEALQSGFEHDSMEQLHKLFLNSSVLSIHENPHSKWTSVFQILDNIVKVSNDSDSVAGEVHTIIGNILKIMDVLDQGTLLGASLVIPLLTQIARLYLSTTGSADIRKMKKEVAARLQNKFRDSSRLRLLEKCTFFDPRFKDADLFQNKSVLNKEILDEMHLQIEVADIDFITEKSQFLIDLFNTLPKQPRSTDQRFLSELDFYFNYHSAGYDENPIHWWKKHQMHFPTLSLLAQKYLAVPLGTKVRTASFLSHRDAEILLFLNSNKDLTKRLKQKNINL